MSDYEECSDSTLQIYLNGKIGDKKKDITIDDVDKPVTKVLFMDMKTRLAHSRMEIPFVSYSKLLTAAFEGFERLLLPT